MHAILSLGLGYLIGCINPAFLLGKKYNVDLKKEGTGNLGATNTLMVLGRKAGFFVAVFDILKSFLSARIARLFFPQLVVAGMIAALGAILGHCFPFGLNFDGGRGLASFGGMILAYNFWLFLFILTTGWLLMVVFDAGVAATVWGCIVFPLVVGLTTSSIPKLLTAIAASSLLIFMHTDKIRLAVELKGGDNVRMNLKEKVFQKKSR